MPFTETFTDDLAVVVGQPTKASEYNNVSNNTDALKERLAIGHHFNNTGVTDEDGYHRADHDDPTWFYAKSAGKYFCFFVDEATGTDVRVYFADSPVNPVATAGYLVLKGNPESAAPAGFPGA